MKKIKCFQCCNLLEKDHVALNKKLLGRQIEKFLCIDCLADYLICTKDDLLVKIEELKEQGCGLFR
jgi:biotin operon repressor